MAISSVDAGARPSRTPVKTDYEAIECLLEWISLASACVSTDFNNIELLGSVICLTFCLSISLSGCNRIL